MPGHRLTSSSCVLHNCASFSLSSLSCCSVVSPSPAPFSFSSSSSASSIVSVESSEDSEANGVGDSDFGRDLALAEAVLAIVAAGVGGVAAGRCCSHLCLTQSAAVMRVLWRGRRRERGGDVEYIRLIKSFCYCCCLAAWLAGLVMG